MTPEEIFNAENKAAIAKMGADQGFKALTRRWFDESCRHRYSYHFSWMGRPIIQYPQDIIALQEIIWDVKPDIIIETGVAHGGSLVFSASMLELQGGPGLVVGIDIDIRAHNRLAIEAHPMFKRIKLLEGSSTSPSILAEVHKLAAGKKQVLVILDSNHTHAHVLEELKLYSPLVTAGSYLIVFDTVAEDMPIDALNGRPWGPGNSPKTAVREFLKSNDRFVCDQALDDKLQITVAPEGFLRCLR